jgi:hypothetical protein
MYFFTKKNAVLSKDFFVTGDLDESESKPNAGSDWRWKKQKIQLIPGKLVVKNMILI